MPLIPATRQQPPPIAGSNPPFEQTLLRGESAAGFGAFQAQNAMIQQSGRAVAGAFEQTADVVFQIDQSRKALKIQEEISEAQRRIADANEQSDLDGMEFTPESTVLKHYQGSMFSPVPLLQRFNPQIGRLNVLLDGKRRQLATRDASSTIKQSATQAIEAGTFEALEASLGLIGGYAHLFGAEPTRELQVTYSQKIAEGIALKQATSNEWTAEATVRALQDDQRVADDPIFSLLTPEARIRTLAAADRTRDFKRNQRMIEDRFDVTAQLTTIARDGYLGPDNAPGLFEEFGPGITLDQLLTVIDEHAPLDAFGNSIAAQAFGLVEDSDNTLDRPTWLRLRAMATEAWMQRAKTDSGVQDIRAWVEKENDATVPLFGTTDVDKSIAKYMDEEAQALSDPITGENLGFQDFTDLYYSAPLPALEKFVGRRLARIPFSADMRRRVFNDMKGNDPNRVQRAYTVFQQARLSPTAPVTHGDLLNDNRVNEAVAFIDNFLTFNQEASPLDAAKQLVDQRAQGKNFEISPSKALAMIESEGGLEMISEHLNTGPGDYVPRGFAHPLQFTAHLFRRIGNGWTRWSNAMENGAQSIRVFGGPGSWGPIHIPTQEESPTLMQELGSVARDILAGDDWIETVRDHRAMKISNMNEDPYDPSSRPPFTPEMVSEYQWVLQDVLLNRNHGGDFGVAMQIADQEFFKRYRYTNMTRDGRAQLTTEPPEEQWAQTGGDSGIIGTMQMSLMLAHYFRQEKGYVTDPSMLWLNTEPVSIRVDPETGLNSYLVMWERPVGPSQTRPEVVYLPNNVPMRYTPHWSDANNFRALLDESRRFRLMEVLGQIGLAPERPPVSGPYVGDQFESMRDLFPELSNSGLMSLLPLQIFQLREFFGPGLNPEHEYMNPPIPQLSEHPDPAIAVTQQWLRGQIQTGELAEVQFGRETGTRLNEALSPGATRSQVTTLLQALGINASPEQIQQATEGIGAPIPGQRRVEPRQVDPRALQ